MRALLRALRMLALVLVTLSGAALAATEPVESGTNEAQGTKPDIVITVIYDNNAYDERLQPDSGFSCLIQGLGETILFDTGEDGDLLLANMQKLGIKPADVDVVFISHDHPDHTGGLAAFIEKNPDVTVYLPKGAHVGWARLVAHAGAKPLTVSSARLLCPGVYSTGPLGGWFKEQALVVETTKGPVVIMGCGHQGLVLTVQRVEDLAEQDVYLLLGGYHLLRVKDEQVQEIVRQLKAEGVRNVAPGHCSEERTVAMLKAAFGENCTWLGVGRKVVIRQREEATEQPEQPSDASTAAESKTESAN